MVIGMLKHLAKRLMVATTDPVAPGTTNASHERLSMEQLPSDFKLHTQRPSLEHLPPELCYQLFEYLEPAQVILLCLTCRRLRNQLPPETVYQIRRCAERKVKIEFLTLLAKDIPESILCTVCMTLHGRMRNESETLVGKGSFGCHYGDRACSRSNGFLKIGEYKCPGIVTREAIQLVLRAVALGSDFGPPLGALKQHTVWQAYSACKLNVQFDTEAEVVRATNRHNGHLVLRTRYHVEIDLETPLANHVMESDVKGCDHEDPQQRDSIVRLLQRVKNDPYSGGSRTQAFSKCRFCTTDTLYEVRRTGNETFAALTVTAWRDLGPGGDHLAEQWRKQIEQYPKEPFLRDARYSFGSRSLQQVYDTA